MDETTPLLSSPPDTPRDEEQDDAGKALDFDPKGDPENPLEWRKSYRYGIVCLQAFWAFTV
jgi:hypothetical protein